MSQFSAQNVVNDIESKIADLLVEVNSASAAARNTWVLFMALLAYFFITLAGVTHKDLLLNKPVILPVLQVGIELRAFFIFAPVVLLLMHFNILLQHAVLAHKLNEFHDRLTRFEGSHLYRSHRLRIQLHSYFYSQALAGPSRSRVFGGFLRAMTWTTLWLLPMLLLLYFQVTFLPAHDLTVTTAHRLYFVADFVIMAVFGIFLRFPGLSFINGLARNLTQHPLSFMVMLLTWVIAMVFSFAVATIPDEGLDRAMQHLKAFRVPVPFGTPAEQAVRYAFWPTAYLFDGEVDPLSGRTRSWFSRNLVVTDVDLVNDGEVIDGEVTLNLRVRDLRYGTFDRSDLHQADLTGADLSRASLREANLQKAKLESARLVATDLGGADLSGADLQRADARGANLLGADLSDAKLTGAILPGAARP